MPLLRWRRRVEPIYALLLFGVTRAFEQRHRLECVGVADQHCGIGIGWGTESLLTTAQ